MKYQNVRVLFLTILLVFMCRAAFAVNYVLNSGDSHSSMYIENSVTAGSVTDNNSRTVHDLFYNESVTSSAQSPNSGANANQYINFRCLFFPDEDSPTFHNNDQPDPWPVPMDMSLKIALSGNGNAHGSPTEDAGYSTDVSVNAKLVWDLMPGDPDEYLNMPVRINVWANYSLTNSSSNVDITGKAGITNFSVNDGLFGPLYSYSEGNWGNAIFNRWMGPNPLEGAQFIIPLGQSLSIEYGFEYDIKNTPFHYFVSSYWDHPLDPTDLYIAVKSERAKLLISVDKQYLKNAQLLDKMQSRTLTGSEAINSLVESAPMDGTTEIIFIVDEIQETENPPINTETPQQIRLTVITPAGVDNGHFIGEGEDNDGDGYDDTPRVLRSTFTQTWVAPPSNGVDKRDIDIKIEVDIDNDGSFDYGFIERFMLKYPVNDNDNDGLPNDWEVANGLDPSDDGTINPDNGPNGNPDNDNSSNIEEFKAGSNPQDPDSRPVNIDIEIHTGLNMFSYPKTKTGGLTSYELLALLGTSNEIERILIYDKSAGLYKTTYYSGAVPAGDNVALEFGDGLLIYSQAEKIISFNAADSPFNSFIECVPINLTVGMNVAAFPCAPADYSVYKLMTDLGGQSHVSNINHYNAITGMFESAIYANGQPAGRDFNIKAGEAYFIFMKQVKINFKPSSI